MKTIQELETNVKNASTLAVKVIAKVSKRARHKQKIIYYFDYTIKNPILVQDVESNCLTGIYIGNRTIFNDPKNEVYSFDRVFRPRLHYPFSKIFNDVVKQVDVRALQELQINKDFFSFEAIIYADNFDGVLHNLTNVKKIEDPELINKIKNLLKKAKKAEKTNK